MRKALAALVLITALAPLPAAATVPVIDPANLIQNMQTAMNTIRELEQEAQAEYTRIQQLQVLVQQAKSYAGGDLMQNRYDQQQQRYENFLNALQDTYGSMANMQQVLQDNARKVSASGLSWDQYMQYLKEAAQRRQQGAMEQLSTAQQALQNVNDNYDRLKQYQAQIPQTAGTQQSLQLLNQQMNLVAGQNQQLLQMLAADSVRRSQQKALDEAQIQGDANQLAQQRQAREQSVDSLIQENQARMRRLQVPHDMQ